MTKIQKDAFHHGSGVMNAYDELNQIELTITQPNGIEFHGIPEFAGNVAAQAYEKGANTLLKEACEWWESRCDYLGISKFQIELFKKAMEEGEQ